MRVFYGNSDDTVNANDFDNPLDQVLADYITGNTPIDIGVEGRIVVK